MGTLPGKSSHGGVFHRPGCGIRAFVTMALRQFAKAAVGSLGLRCGASLAPLVDSSASLRSLAVRGYATGVI